jgi:hypothetical protein
MITTRYKKLGFVGFVDEDGDMIWHKNLGNGIYVYLGTRAKGTAGACREISFGPWEGEANTSNPIKGVSAIRVLRTVKQWLDTTSVKCYAEAGDARLARFYAKLGWTGFFQINY